MGFCFENLDVYTKAIDFVNDVYLLTRTFPKEEIFGLTNQLRRSAVSIPLNISEGSARSKKDFARFIDIARGSIFECAMILKISLGQGYLERPLFEKLNGDLVEMSKMLSGLKSTLGSKVKLYEQ